MNLLNEVIRFVVAFLCWLKCRGSFSTLIRLSKPSWSSVASLDSVELSNRAMEEEKHWTQTAGFGKQVPT